MPDTSPKSFILTQVPPDSRDRSASSASRAGNLEEAVLASAIGRVRAAALISGVVWTLALVANVIFRKPSGQAPLLPGAAGWPMPNVIYAAVGALGSFILADVISRTKARARVILDLGLGLEIFTAALVALCSFNRVEPHMARISWVAVVILVYPAIAPAAPKRVLAAGLIAATMDVIAFGLAVVQHRAGSVPPGQLAGILAWMAVPNYLCAFLALVPATLIRRLGREAGAARELGSYRVGRLIDRGGMGEVYEATHRMIAKPAAIKLIRPDLLADSPDVAEIIVERFYREAEAVAALRSPHTVSLYDFGAADDGTLYYVMELLDGINLQRLVDRFGPLPPERVIHILTQVCDSLGEAHGRGMVHRDIKPSNILLCHLGLTADFVKVLDFGLVRREAQPAPGAEGLSGPLGQPGTPSYMPPEAVRDLGPVDRRADIYALGCVGYWLLTGHTVFEGSSPVEMMYHHGYDEPVPPSVRAGLPLPVELEAVILSTLAKSPADRPQAAEELARRLSACATPGAWGAERAQAWWAQHVDAVRGSRG